MSETLTTCRLRLKAAKEVDACGLAKRHFQHEGAVCLLGSLMKANGHRGLRMKDIIVIERDRRYLATRAAVAAMGFENLEEAVRWNDAPERTKEEVIARLRDGCQP